MKNELQKPESKSDYIHNVVRNKKLTYLKRSNMKLAGELAGYAKAATMDAHQRELCDNLIHSLRSCGGATLYSYDGAKIELISFLGCGHRLCNICNWDRQKKIRRKYLLWFKANPFLFSITKDGKEKVVTGYQLNKWLLKGYTENGKVSYNIMHLMLSVPHTMDGWRGKRFYFRELTKQFNFMRKKEDWLYWVYGGQFGLEITKNDNGYHIHIHALLFVRKSPKNRNQLHKVVLYWWNRLTIDERNKRGTFSNNEVAAILKGNSDLDAKFVKELDPRGATIVHLKNSFKKKRVNGEIYIDYVDSSDGDPEEFIGAVMETISYLFKPKIFAVTDRYFDCEAIIDILPHVYNNRSLYSKFGCLLGEKTLNIHDTTLLEDMNEAAELKGEELPESYSKQFFITNPANTYSTKSQIRLKRHNTGTVSVPASCTSEAVKMLYESGYQKPTF